MYIQTSQSHVLADHLRRLCTIPACVLLLAGIVACDSDISPDIELLGDTDASGAEEEDDDDFPETVIGDVAFESTESAELANPETNQPTPLAARACSQNNDCFSSSCYCGDDNYCKTRSIGPLPPAGTCDLAPVRACSSASDCQSGCGCLGGVCAVAVSPPNPSCHLPPPDSYEYDDSWQSWSAYSGPQVHSFHHAGDVDWVAVYFLNPGTVRFRTHSLANQADTRLKVFAFDNHVKGALLGVHDDIGGWYFIPDSKSSRIDLEVPADSLFLMKVIDRSPPSVYTDNHQFPVYTLELSYI